jgi:hypothetical protein
MSKSPDDIIELTDIIEHGPNASRQEGAEGGVDLSFERELEDLFAESPDAPKADAPAPDIPGLDDLHLPGDEPKAEGEGDIDLDGLDALLADAEKSQSGGLNLPELPDDFLNEASVTAPAAAASEAAAMVSDHAGQALSARLDALEDKLSTLGDTLAASFKSMLDEAVAGLKADMPAAAPSIDEEALAARIRDEVLAALPQSEASSESAAADPAPMIEEATARLQGAIDAVQNRVDAVPADVSSMLDELAERTGQRMDELESRIPAGEAQDVSGLATREELDQLRQDVLAEIRKAVPAAAAQVIREEIQALLQDAD